MKILKFAAIAGVLAVAMLTGCEKSYSPKKLFSEYDYPERTIAEDVVVTTEFSEYDRSVEKIKLTVINNGDEALWSGEQFYLKKLEDGEWRNVAVGGRFPAIGYTYDPSTSLTYTATLKDHVKLPLPKGEYRVGFLFERSSEDCDYVSYGEFTVK